jgi:hypothetical protein
MEWRGAQSYDLLDTPTLTNLLLNPNQHREIHRATLSAFSRRSAEQRCPRLVLVIRSIIHNPTLYDQDVMMSAIDILATDPESAATSAFLEALPDVLDTGMGGDETLKYEFREYYYTALMTRQRPADLEVWSEKLPALPARSLVAMMIDPAADSLQTLEPLTLIARLREPDRTKALFSVIAGVIRNRCPVERAYKAARMLAKSSDPAQFEEGMGFLNLHKNRYKAAQLEDQAQEIGGAMKIIDPKPRSTTERLTGRRPWAS